MQKLTLVKRLFLNKKGDALYIELSQVIQWISTGQIITKNGTLDLVSATNNIRQCSSHEQQQKLKLSYLPAVMFNGEFEDGNLTNNGLLHYSPFTALDYDGFPNDELLQQTYRRLKITPCVALVYHTPSGRGLKAVIKHDNTDPQQHSDLYDQLLNKLHVDGVTLDTTCRNLNRFHYLCYDPNIWVRPDIEPYHYVPTQPQVIQNPVQPIDQGGKDASISDRSILNMLKWRCKHDFPNFLCEGHRHEGIYWLGLRCGEAGIDSDLGAKFVENLYNGDDITYTYGDAISRQELFKHFKRGYDSATFSATIRASYIKKQ